MNPKTFSITGTLSIPRKDMVHIIEKSGFVFKAYVGTMTDYLIVGVIHKYDVHGNPTPSNKLNRAMELNISGNDRPKIITESDFYDMISRANP